MHKGSLIFVLLISMVLLLPGCIKANMAGGVVKFTVPFDMPHKPQQQ